MKNVVSRAENRSVSRADARPDSDDFRLIFLNDLPLIDTRSPGEFEKGAFPTSVNLPLMSNEERAQVGTCYKRQGQAAAIELGHQLVSGELKAERVAAWLDFAERHPEGYLYCWRGGLRSQICQQWLADADCAYPRISGGYKAMRRFLIDEFERICEEHSMLLIGGRTGCNKTALVADEPRAVDLEGLANHLGSSFGRRPGGQPTQLNFENALAVDLLKAEHQAARAAAGLRAASLQKSGTGPQRLPIVLEDEGRMVGRCSIPLALQTAMSASPLVVLEVPLAERIEHSYRNYILNKLDGWQSRQGEAAGFAAFADDLTQSLYRVRKRLGGQRYQAISTQLQQALEAHRQGDPEPHRGWIERLLVDYYDPMYDYQISKCTE